MIHVAFVLERVVPFYLLYITLIWNLKKKMVLLAMDSQSKESLKLSPSRCQDADPRSGAAGRPFPAGLQPVLQSGLRHRWESSLPVLDWLLPSVGLRRGTLLLPLAKVQGRAPQCPSSLTTHRNIQLNCTNQVLVFTAVFFCLMESLFVCFSINF